MLQLQNTKDQAQRIAALLIHGLHRDPTLFETCTLGARSRIIDLMDTSLPDLYRIHGIDEGKADFQKIDVLRGLINVVTSEIDQAATHFISVDTLDGDRNDFHGVLGRHRTLLAPVMPAELQRRRLKEVFDAVQELRGEEGPELVGAHDRAAEALTQLSDELQSAGPFAQRAFTGLVEHLQTLTQEVYRTSSVTDPASLSAHPTAKKYPLRRVGEELRLALSVENRGPGQAVDAYLDELDAVGVRLAADTLVIGTLMPGRVTTSILAVADGTDGQALVEGTLRWRDSDGSERSRRFDAVFAAQRSNIDWDRLEQPYDLEPVSTAAEFVGRRETLIELQDLALATRIGNAFLTGQKRVGKTSIVLTLRSVLRERDEDLAVVYIEAGAYVAPDGARTIAQLGRSLCEELGECDRRLGGAEIPEFADTLAPFKGFVGQLRTRVPKLRVLVVLDEFDELPVELYRRGPVGDALFLSMRTLAGLEHIGFVLVGGEKIGPIVDAQGDVLNKFQSYSVSYFDRERHWDDFCDLVREPVVDWLEVTDEAIVRLFELTSGHPYFTKMVCRELFKLMRRRRDAHATTDEIATAADAAIEGAGVPNFTHFWEDGIVDTGESVEEISIRRRKLLLAYAESVEAGSCKIAVVQERAALYGLDEFETRDLLREFVRRGVLLQDNEHISARVGLFDRWLARYGVSAITTTFTDPDAILRARQRDREEHVGPGEIAQLVQGWGVYRGSQITTEDVRGWLNQFDSIRAQRLMFGILQAVRFYDSTRIRAKLREAHGVVRRGLTRTYQQGKLKRDDIVISYLGEVGKSGARYARLYADENGIYTDQVVDHSKLPERLADERVQALVLIDDLLGSGQQACEFLKELDAKVGGMLENRGVKCVFVTLCGFGEAERRVTETIERLRMPVDMHICDPLGEEERCFSDRSTAFPDTAERVEARGIAESVGKRLQRRQPLGYGGVQATVVFEDSCPNSTLPILWESKGSWRALFPRHHNPA